ncbi:MAG: PorV/PorQ family protein [Candidatus Zixiibacteriota bacterium]
MSLPNIFRAATLASLFSIAASLANIAAAADPGSIGFNFLKVSPGARNAAMGDVGTSISTNLYGVYFNPAATAHNDVAVIGFMHHEGIFDTRREFIGGSGAVLGGVLTAGFDYFKFGSLEERLGPTEEPIGLFDAQDMLAFAGYARQFSPKLSAGFSAKYAAEKIEARTADAFLFDLGVQFAPIEKATFGVAVRHIGSKPKFGDDEIELPLTFSAGAGVDVNNLIAAVEVSAPKESDIRVNFGAEKLVAKMIAFRAGYKIGYDEEDFAAGVGFKKSIWEIDYAFVPYKSGLGSAHRFALTVNLK